jgi:hypothetical protein
MAEPPPAPSSQRGVQTPQIVSDFYDFMLWCMDRTQRFPRNYRGTLSRWVEDQLWSILNLLIEAAYSRQKLSLLQQGNLQLQKLRFLIRLCKDRQCLSLGQYEHAARIMNALGTALGGWIKQQHSRGRDTQESL